MIDKQLTIAIDFDNTLTADPDLWRAFVDHAMALGHRVVCVTSRMCTLENIEILDVALGEAGIQIPIYYTDLYSKLSHMKKIGIDVDIWIDDDPRSLVVGH